MSTAIQRECKHGKLEIFGYRCDECASPATADRPRSEAALKFKPSRCHHNRHYIEGYVCTECSARWRILYASADVIELEDRLRLVRGVLHKLAEEGLPMVASTLSLAKDATAAQVHNYYLEFLGLVDQTVKTMATEALEARTDKDADSIFEQLKAEEAEEEITELDTEPEVPAPPEDEEEEEEETVSATEESIHRLAAAAG